MNFILSDCLLLLKLMTLDIWFIWWVMLFNSWTCHYHDSCGH